VYDLVIEAGSPEATEFAPAMDETTGILPDLPAVAGKVVHVAFDGGRLTSDGGILLLAAIEGAARDRRTLGRLHRGPASARAGAAWLAEMIRYRALLIAARLSRRQQLRRAQSRSRLQDADPPRIL
jgi:hypothetical protein